MAKKTLKLKDIEQLENTSMASALMPGAGELLSSPDMANSVCCMGTVCSIGAVCCSGCSACSVQTCGGCSAGTCGCTGETI